MFFTILVSVSICLESNSSLQQKYSRAKNNFLKNSNEKNTIWFGRRAAYLGKYGEAISIYSKGIKKFPDSYRLFRHRGHRYISTRDFKKAIIDLEKAKGLLKDRKIEIEKDGMPNKYNIPVSNTQFNIYYHLGLAYYLTGQYKKAEHAYRQNIKHFSPNNDCLIANTHWLYMTYLRLNNKKRAEEIIKTIRSDTKHYESGEYLNCIKVYKGIIDPETFINNISIKNNISAAFLYGIGNWYIYKKNKKHGLNILKKILKKNPEASFGYIAAETDLKKFENR